jgi:hypothetical protein
MKIKTGRAFGSSARPSASLQEMRKASIYLLSGKVPEKEALLPLPPDPLVKEAGTVLGRLLLVVALVAALATLVVVVRLRPPMEESTDDEAAVLIGAVAATAKFCTMFRSKKVVWLDDERN